MMKIQNFYTLLAISSLLLSAGCLPPQINENISYNSGASENIEISDKVKYLLEGVIDLENDPVGIWNKPLETDQQKGRFLFDILNNNYMDYYENPEEKRENPPYPIVSSTLIQNKGDIHDGIEINGKNMKIAYDKREIDEILQESIGSTIKDGNLIDQDGLIFTGEKYLLFNYQYYGSNLIGNKGRATQFEIQEIHKVADKDLEIQATYFDDILQEGKNYEIKPCKITYRITENPQSVFGYQVREYLYTGCQVKSDYLPADMPSQMIYHATDGIFYDAREMKKGLQSVEKTVDLDNDEKDEFFRIGPDSPNGTMILGIYGDQGYNFIYDFKRTIVDDYNELLDGLFVEMYTDDFTQDAKKDIIIVIGDKKTWSEAILYQVQPGSENVFQEIGHFDGKKYFIYDSESRSLHAPYSDHGLCKTYQL